MTVPCEEGEPGGCRDRAEQDGRLRGDSRGEIRPPLRLPLEGCAVRDGRIGGWRRCPSVAAVSGGKNRAVGL